MIALTDINGKACLVAEEALLYVVAGQTAKDTRGSTLVFGHDLYLGVLETPAEMLERIAEVYGGEYEAEFTDEDEEEGTDESE